MLSSPYRFILVPIVQFVLDLSKRNPRRDNHRAIVTVDKMVHFFKLSARACSNGCCWRAAMTCIFTVTAPWYYRPPKYLNTDVARPLFRALLP